MIPLDSSLAARRRGSRVAARGAGAAADAGDRTAQLHKFSALFGIVSR
jgi:hypothetical protein